jgi:Na+-driven multidrug efflux pump
LTYYFAGRMRVGPRFLVAVGVLPIAVHLTLAWLLIDLLSWSVAGAGLARLGAALVALAAALGVAGAELGGLVGRVPEGSRRPERALLWTMFTEGSLLGLQQVLAGLMVLGLYFKVAGAGNVASAALTLTHGGVYPLLFALAWGSSQAVGDAAAQVVGRGDARELARVTWLGLALAVVFAVALPWGAYAACGGPTLAWLVEGSPAGAAVLAASVRFMGLLAVFFVFDFAINFLSALLRAAKEQAYLLLVTAAVATGFGLLLLTFPAPEDTGLMGTFIVAQAALAALLLGRVVRRWPGGVAPRGAVGSRGRALRPPMIAPVRPPAVSGDLLSVKGGPPVVRGAATANGQPRAARRPRLRTRDPSNLQL